MSAKDCPCPSSDFKLTLYENANYNEGCGEHGKKYVFTEKCEDTSSLIKTPIRSAQLIGKKNWKLYSVAYPTVDALPVTELEYSTPKYPKGTKMPGVDKPEITVYSLYPVDPEHDR
ncbi:uncharacterized protein [Amphiura filiformis]|uniref:uncharacterized protein n=1 Tax=Amphiura filiformis TaxID=82378 RepID=UPI003B22508E